MSDKRGKLVIKDTSLKSHLCGLALAHRSMTSSTSCRHFPTTCRFTCSLFNGAVPFEFRCFLLLPELRLLLSYTLWRSSDFSPVIYEKMFTVREMLPWLPGIMFVLIPEPLDQKLLSNLFTTFYFAVTEYSFYLIFQ
jgi:hypothetical protein